MAIIIICFYFSLYIKSVKAINHIIRNVGKNPNPSMKRTSVLKRILVERTSKNVIAEGK